MVQITLRFSKDNYLISLTAEGHAIKPEGQVSIPCAAATMLLRSVSRTFEARLLVKGGAYKEGQLDLRLPSIPSELKDWAGGVTDTLLTGLTDLMREYPDEVSVTQEYIS